MSAKLRVLSIDDNHQNLSILQQALESQFDVISSPGEESIEDLIFDCEPDIILLDIMLTDTNGYEVCKQIRQMKFNKKVVIIFISSLQSLEDKIKAYEAGGDDYICKPVNLEELIYKLSAYEKLIYEKQNLAVKAEEASKAAFASMQQSSELGVLFEFFSAALSILDFDSLFQATENVISKFQFNCAVEFRTQNTTAQFPSEHLSQLESEILELGKRAKRIVPFGKNVLFNSRQCSLLIKNLPQDEGALGRLRDHLVIFLDIISNQVKAIEYEENRQLQQRRVISIIQDQYALNAKQLKQHNQQLFSELNNDITQQLSVTDSNRQRELTSMLDNYQQEMDQAIQSSFELERQSEQIEQQLNQLK